MFIFIRWLKESGSRFGWAAFQGAVFEWKRYVENQKAHGKYVCAFEEEHWVLRNEMLGSGDVVEWRHGHVWIH